MSGEPSRHDRDLLSRLDALKKLTIDLDEKQLRVSPSQPTSLKTDIDPLVGNALHSDISERFRALQGTNGSSQSSPPPTTESTMHGDVVPESQTEDDDKTVEELLAELGPDEELAMGKSEEDQVRDLLKEAQDALRDTSQSERLVEEPDTEAGASAFGQAQPAKGIARIPDIDLSVFQPEPDTDSDDAAEEKPRSQLELKQSLDREADEFLERIMDEIRHAKPTQHGDEADEPPPPRYQEEETTTSTSSSLPRAPLSSSLDTSKDTPLPSPQASASAAAATTTTTTTTSTDPNLSDLSTHFSSLSLSLPSVPTTALKPPPPPPTRTTTTSSSPPSYTDADIDTWCIICTDDATLRCIGCDGDLYCRNCWIEGHRDWEERRHRAMVYSRDGRKRKEEMGEGVGGGIVMG